jgi:thioredoxin-related protein
MNITHNIGKLLSAMIIAVVMLSGCNGSDGNQAAIKDKGQTLSNAGAIEWQDFNAAFASAKEYHKPVMVVYETSWCTWCKKLKSTTFADPLVARQINDLVIPVKVDGEGQNEIEFRGTQLTETAFTHNMKVSGYPTTIFFDEEGNELARRPGYMPPEPFGLFLNFVSEGAYKNEDFESYAKRKMTG